MDAKTICSRIVLETTSYPEIEDGALLETDVLVIGSGAGGAVAAKILAEAGRSVTVVEEGALSSPKDLGDDPEARIQKLWRSGVETLADGSVPIHIPTGRAVGGTTFIGCGSLMRTPSRVLDRWVDWGLDHLSADQMAAEFIEIEEVLSVHPMGDALIGRNGELLRDGAKALGFTSAPVPRSVVDCEGSGICVLGCPTEAKQSVDLTYLPRARLNGAKVIERVRIDSLLMDSGRAGGVRGTLLDANGRERGAVKFTANDIVLAAGYLHTPKLMATADLGNPEHVGRHLQIHPCAGVVGVFEDDVSSAPAAVQTWYVDHFAESHGVLIEATSLIPEMSPGLDTSRMAYVAVFAADTGEGDLIADGESGLRPRYEIHPDDVTALGFGVFQSARILLAAGARAVLTGHKEMPKVTSFAEAEALSQLRWEPAYFKPVSFHPVGTARMGADPEVSVVDTGGRVWGIPNLRVADASILPCCPEVNPQETIMAVAAKVARSAAQ
ncbi:MAG: oxidoreductase [Acidobacteria bacterium]|nr:MAG: oxidoreductase [Acidobacteriota bacterium]